MYSRAQGYSFCWEGTTAKRREKKLKTCVSSPFASIPMSLGTPVAVWATSYQLCVSTIGRRWKQTSNTTKSAGDVLTAFNSSFFRKVCQLPPFLAKAEIIGALPHRSRQYGLS